MSEAVSRDEDFIPIHNQNEKDIVDMQEIKLLIINVEICPSYCLYFFFEKYPSCFAYWQRIGKLKILIFLAERKAASSW